MTLHVKVHVNQWGEFVWGSWGLKCYNGQSVHCMHVDSNPKLNLHFEASKFKVVKFEATTFALSSAIKKAWYCNQSHSKHILTALCILQNCLI